ncbi:DUF3168 domain-containing protein [Patescibacteria group bacterium]|nr:DUF3168 domain-containing protein [Patescibacteria group bacterium]
MDIAAALNKYLLSQSTVVAIVGDRIYPMKSPVDCEYPLIVYQEISDIPYHAMGQDASIYSPRFQVSVFAQSYSSAKNVSSAVKSSLRDATGTWGGVSGVTVDRCLFELETERVDLGDDDTNTLYFVSQDYIIWYR